MTTAMSLLNIMSFIHLVDDFAYRNLISAVSSISEQINLLKRQSSVCVCVPGACVRVCELRKLLVYCQCNFCIFNNCSSSFKIYKMCYCVR